MAQWWLREYAIFQRVWVQFLIPISDVSQLSVTPVPWESNVSAYTHGYTATNRHQSQNQPTEQPSPAPSQKANQTKIPGQRDSQGLCWAICLKVSHSDLKLYYLPPTTGGSKPPVIIVPGTQHPPLASMATRKHVTYTTPSSGLPGHLHTSNIYLHRETHIHTKK